MLNLVDIDIHYGAIHAIKKASISIEKGEIVAIIGSNGAGKSTLIKGICGIVPVPGGSISFNGELITNTPTHEVIKKGVSCAPEGRKIFPQLSVKDNLLLGSFTVKKEKDQNSQMFEYVLDTFPVLAKRQKQLGGTLSGGEQQMLAIGRAMMSRPKLLLLDEPSLGLAPIIVEEVFEIIKKLSASGVTILLAEQNAFQSLLIAHRAYVLELGQVKLSGSAEEVMGNSDVKHAYLGVKID